MNTQSQVTPAIRPHVAVIDGQIKTTSLKVAEHFGKRHDDVLRRINNLDCSPEFAARNFAASKYQVAGGKNTSREEIMYEITRDGFMFLAMGFTGAKAAQWKEAYINAFNRMESELQGKTDPFLADNTYRVAAQKAFNAHWDKCHADMESAGVKSPVWPKVDDKVITGVVASMMWRGRWIVSFDNDQRMQLSPMSDHDCVVDSCNPERIKSFINCLDFDTLHSVIEAVFARVNRQMASNKS